jgi:malate dehydrogenase (oxaloacetate-decarboxylating)(NADP+)
VAYNLLKEVGEADAIGPILLGLKKPVHVLQLGSSRSIVNVAMIADYRCRSNELMWRDGDQEIEWWKRLKKTK